jgi:hypothetical protein
MNDLSANDILLFGALAGALALVLCSGLWALAHRGRKRWSAARADRVAAEGIQIITAAPGDAVVVTYPGHMTAEQRNQIVEAMERRLPKGVSAMVLEGGLRMSHVVSVKDAPEPPARGHVPPRPIPQPKPAS